MWTDLIKMNVAASATIDLKFLAVFLHRNEHLTFLPPFAPVEEKWARITVL